MLNKTKIKRMMRCLSSDDKESFLLELLESIEASKKINSFEPIEACINAWEATIELIALPGVKENIWERFERLKSSGVIRDGNLDN